MPAREEQTTGPPQGRDEWEQYAIRALDAFFDHQGAAVWPEVEAQVSESPWVHEHFDPSLPRHMAPNPHHLTTARQVLVAGEVLIEDRRVLLQRPVSVWVYVRALTERGRQTSVQRLAAAKRRLYRTFLSWTGDNRLCGDVAERALETTLASLTGSHVWLSPSSEIGGVRELLNRPLRVGGPLDAAGHWAADPENPAAGFVPFAVEVKNVRATIYPWDHETWDLLAKLGDFPEVVPVLVARRVHLLTFRFFKDIGAVACQTWRQWFSRSIDAARFARVRDELSFHDAVQIDPSTPHKVLAKFFSDTGRSLASAQAAKWERAAPIVARYIDLRREDLEPRERSRLWFDFSQEIIEAGLNERNKWAPLEAEL